MMSKIYTNLKLGNSKNIEPSCEKEVEKYKKNDISQLYLFLIYFAYSLRFFYDGRKGFL